MARMTAGKFRHMPSSSVAACRLVSIGDIVKHRLHDMERESEAMPNYIMTA
jgi:hypothetical protein